MDLTTCKDVPNGKIQKFDVSVAKNHLSEKEIQQLQHLDSAYLDLAEDMAMWEIPMTMEDWKIRLNRFIEATDRKVLQDAGKVLLYYCSILKISISSSKFPNLLKW